MDALLPQPAPIFARLWPLAGLFHLLSLGEQGSSWLGMILWAIGGLCLVLRPSTAVFCVFCVAQLVEVAIRLPWVANHWLFFAWVNLVLLVGIIQLGRGDAKGWTWPSLDAVFDRVRGVLGLGLALLYVMAVFHKFNADYWNLDQSCAMALWQSVPQLPSLEGPDDLGWRRFIIAGSLALELLIPALLLVKRTRWIGVVLGVSFHVLLGFVPYETYYNFSFLLVALYILILPSYAYQTLQARWEAACRWVWQRGPRWTVVIRLIFTLLLIWIVWDSQDFSKQPEWIYRGVRIFQVVGPLLALAIVASLWRPKSRRAVRSWTAGFAWPHWALLFLLAVNVTGPYIGWKSELSFSMYSNLRVKNGQSNHWLLPSPPDLWGWQSDWVEIRSVSAMRLRGIQRKQQDMTWLEFRDYLARDCGQGARYTRNQKRYRKREGDRSPPFSTPLPWWTRKLIRFRPVDRGAVQSCVH